MLLTRAGVNVLLIYPTRLGRMLLTQGGVNEHVLLIYPTTERTYHLNWDYSYMMSEG